ncbi:MAG: hypothetical protein LBJ17_01125 [Dysgonamonadaceae bacterium]|nr:hypothetical protein [Dysgonamonadaceae bacterium]
MFLSFTALAAVFRYSMPDGGHETQQAKEYPDSITAPNVVAGKKIKYQAKTVEMSVDTFILPIICYGVPANRKVRFFPPEVTITVCSTDSEQHPFLKDDFETGVAYHSLLDSSSPACSVTLTKKPAWVSEYHISPSEVEFLFE